MIRKLNYQKHMRTISILILISMIISMIITIIIMNMNTTVTVGKII